MQKHLSHAERNHVVERFSLKYNIQPAVMKAIIEVESSSSGFYSKKEEFTGKCRVRFEPDWFVKFASSRPYFLPASISPETAKRNSQFTNRHAFERALIQSPQAAIKATSFGLGQIMGFNYQKAGYSDVLDFVHDMEESEYFQLEAMMQFIVSNRALLVAIQQNEFELIAKLYNGKNYIQGNYHNKLKDAYNRILDTEEVIIVS